MEVIMEINWNAIPKYEINLRKLDSPNLLCHIFKHYNIDKYVYRIKFKELVIKFGMSADNSRDYGDRVYRQVGHMSSWPQGIRLDGSSGSDFRIVETDFLTLYGFPLDHKYTTITVWNVTDYNFQSVDSRKEILAMEAQLINTYTTIVGTKPIGNINDEAYNKERPHIRKDILANLIENIDDYVK